MDPSSEDHADKSPLNTYCYVASNPTPTIDILYFYVFFSFLAKFPTGIPLSKDTCFSFMYIYMYLSFYICIQYISYVS